MTEPTTVPHDADADREDLIECLLNSAKIGDVEKARGLLDAIVALRESTLRAEMGRLASECQSGLGNMGVDERLANLAYRRIPDAKERLDFVITKTEEAADQTMSALEAAMPTLEALREEANELRGANATSTQVHEFLERVIANGESVSTNLSQVMMAQAFQDITGQVIRNVIGLLQELEQNLSELVRAPNEGRSVTPSPEQSARGSAGYGPAALEREKTERVSGQDDVDALLSQLGI